MKNDSYFIRMKNALAVIAGIIGITTILLVGFDIYLLESINMRIILPILIIVVLVTFFIIGYFLNIKKTSG